MAHDRSPTDAAPRRVLIAEDEALIRLDLAEMLREEGYEVVGEAGDGQEAVELAESLRPDLVIMDVKMPRRDGIDAAAEIAAKRIAPIVVLTAFSQRDLVERARDAGAMAYLVKPFSITDLIPAIEVAVSRFGEISRAGARSRRRSSDRLETRKLVERAKGLLQTKHGMTEPEAFKWIQRAAMDRRTTMKRVAEVVLETLDDADRRVDASVPPSRSLTAPGELSRLPTRALRPCVGYVLPEASTFGRGTACVVDADEPLTRR